MKTRTSSKSAPSQAKLPSQRDFDPYNGNLNAQYAWKNFGGLDLDSAYRKFCEKPFHYQEDFMFMGPAAFKFYFPVIDRYLREVRANDEFEDCEAWILGKAIHTQLEEGVADELMPSIDGLCRYVRAHLTQYASTPREQKRIDKAWILNERRIIKIKRMADEVG